MMRFITIFVFFFALSVRPVAGRQLQQRFDKTSFYNVMASGNINKINDELKIVEAVSIPEKEAYEGALLMRKAGLLKKAADKLRSFKSGCIKLESSLLKDSTNGEYHFLRLTIQEHAPRTVKYYKDLGKDSLYVHNTFKNLSPEIQKAIIDYSKNSKILRPEDFRIKNL
jgi:hypothetical protein